MKKLLLTIGFSLIASSSHAATKDELTAKAGIALVDSLVEMQLQIACDTYITDKGKAAINVNPDCISNVNSLRSALESDSAATKLLKKVDLFMQANDIPSTDGEV